MTCFRRAIPRGFPAALFVVFSLALTACVIETPEQVFTTEDIVQVNAATAAKMGFTPIEGRTTYLYTDPEDSEDICPEVGFVPLDDEGRLYIAANFSGNCMDESGRWFYMLADFEAGTLKAVSGDDAHMGPVIALAKEHGITLRHDDVHYRYVADEGANAETMKAFFRALAASDYALDPRE